MMRYRKNAAGATNSKESIRSSTAVARQHAAHVLDAVVPLHEGLGQIVERRSGRDHETEEQGLDPQLLERVDE